MVLPIVAAVAILPVFRQTRCALVMVDLDHFSASFGVAAWPDRGANPDDLLKAADRALYASKHTGRDRVTLA